MESLKEGHRPSHPPVYILTTMLFHDVRFRAKAFGVISGIEGSVPHPNEFYARSISG
jgi:hypothetical protein